MLFKLTFLEFFIRLLPEAFFLILSGYAYSRIRIDKKYLIISTFILAIIGFITRLLPISQGVYTILDMIGMMLLLIFINKIDVLKAITSAVIIFIITAISEFIIISIYTNLLHVDMSLVQADKLLRIEYGIPSLLIVMLVVSSYYLRLSKKGKLKNVSYRNGIE